MTTELEGPVMNNEPPPSKTTEDFTERVELVIFTIAKEGMTTVETVKLADVASKVPFRFTGPNEDSQLPLTQLTPSMSLIDPQRSNPWSNKAICTSCNPEIGMTPWLPGKLFDR